MLGLLGTAALALVAAALWVLPAAAGGKSLKPPQNAEVYIIDDNFTLQWNRSDESIKNVTFSADYQISPEMDNWIKLPGCQHIEGTKCNFSLPELNVYEKMKLRIKAERKNNTSSWHYIDSFVPFVEAHISPPGLHLLAEDKAIIIHISRPGEEGGNMWALSTFGFLYNIVMWENATGVEKKIETSNYRDKIFKLSPETTYCFKIKARLLVQRKHSPYSPVYCINTTVENELPSPENIEVDARSDSFVLKWDYPYVNTTFQARWLLTYSKRTIGNYSDDWEQISECENVNTTHCVFPKKTLIEGTYFISVRASDGNKTSFWSEEKKFDTKKHAVMSPPVITVKSTNDSLRVYISTLEDSMKEFYSLAYEIIFWENNSNTERKFREEKPEFTIANLQPLTIYCIKVRAHLVSKKNKSSGFSDTVCEKTKPGSSSTTWLIAGVCIALASVPVVIYIVKCLLRCLSYVFFPPLTPPCNIDECFSEKPLKNLLLLTSEEQTERCFIIENTDMIARVEGTNHTDDRKKYDSQSSQDSGNYSNEDENMGSQTGEEFLQQEPLSPETSSVK